MTEPAERHSRAEPGSTDATSRDQGDEATSLLETHRDFVLSIDDASRIGHSVLGGATLAAVVVALIVRGQHVFSLGTLLLVPVVAIVALLVGRFAGLARQDRRLRQRIVAYGRNESVSIEELVREAARQGRYEFFVKLSVPLLERGVDGQR